ncbi:MAG: response regulator transcription factor [Gammaproteobacteria bacterium]|nr:response regulator transcription factor [Gammaproteobacteria bacterium]
MIRILVIDDHPLVQAGLSHVFADTDDIKIISAARNGEEALAALAKAEFDVAILDISMPGKHGIEVLRDIVARHEKLPVLLYTRFPEEHYAVRTLRSGAAGYLHKGADPDEIIAAVRALASGGTYITPSVGTLLKVAVNRKREEASLEDLSDREYQIFQMIVTGKGSTQIANELHLSVKTVSTHRTRLLQKLGLSTTADLVRFALRQGIDEAFVG